MPDWGVDQHEIWATEQLKRSRLSEATVAAVTRLLVTWWKLPPHSAEVADEIVFTFSELVHDHALKIPEEHVEWIPVRPGQINVRDIVRVKLDAYAGELGKIHNGRIARVVAIRSGDIIVNTIDDGPRFESTHHSPYALDRRVELHGPE